MSPARRPGSGRTRGTRGSSGAICGTRSATSWARTPRATSPGCGSTGARSSPSTRTCCHRSPRARAPTRCRRSSSPGTWAATSASARRRAATRSRCGQPASRSATSTIVAEAPGRREPLAQRAFDELTLPDGHEPAVNLLCVNAPQVPELAEQVGEEQLRSRYTIGQWAWETDAIPAFWDRSFDLVDEVWVYSDYVAENLARATDVDVPVVVVPLPVVAPDPHGATVPFEVPDGFVFLFAFDFFSTLQRKNPLGLIEAFSQAFEPGEGPTLLLKTINAQSRPEARERLRYAIGDRTDIRLVDAVIEPAEMAALFRRADCYVSLHRAEGFGLTLGRIDGARQAGHRHRLLRQHGLHDPRELLPRRLGADRGRPGSGALPGGRHVGRAFGRARRAPAARGLRRPGDGRGAWRARRRGRRRVALARGGRVDRARPARADRAPAPCGAARRRERHAGRGRRVRAPARVRPRRRRPREARRESPAARCSASCGPTRRRSGRSTGRWRRRSGSSGSSCTPTAPRTPASRRGSPHQLVRLGEHTARLTRNQEEMRGRSTPGCRRSRAASSPPSASSRS